MLTLFDNGTPAPLRHALTGHTVVEAIERGWDRLVNGELIAAAEMAGFELLVTTDKNIRRRRAIGKATWGQETGEPSLCSLSHLPFRRNKAPCSIVPCGQTHR